MSEENKKPEEGQTESPTEPAADQAAEPKSAAEMTAAGDKAPGEAINPSASSDAAGMAPADTPPKPGGATAEQQAEAAKLQNADPSAQTTSEPTDSPAAEQKEQAAEARAARAAARAAQEGGSAPAAEGADDDKEAKAKAAAEARAARAAARAGKTAEPDTPKEPSPKQPLLDRLVQIIKENVGDDAIEEASINERDGHVPTVVVKNDRWLETAHVLKQHAELKLHYLRNVGGNDMETHLEVVYHLLSLEVKQDYCFKVKTPREAASVPSITPTWATGNWNEREIYDLLGIDFPGHPDLRRIMMPDDWVGYPLRKDYEPLDPEV